MANDTTIMVRGRAGTTPRLMDGKKGDWTTFRLATSSRYRLPGGQWRDGRTTWYTVHANGDLAGRAADSVRSGAPLVVRGRVELDTYADRDGVPRSDLVLQADAIGLDIVTSGRIVWRPPARRDATDVSDLAELDESANEDADVDAVACGHGEPERETGRGGADALGDEDRDGEDEGGAHGRGEDDADAMVAVGIQPPF
ncbi:MAG: hypothetical protein BGO96_14375 [Micrococcales bacterium 73-15]|uniref:single-stranded DNA-binding protein n=1 Tax=Salana multivorans TaxID=120377 RepID=UPI00095A1DDA|nr:single-stranded DNA-binding protein [Salana multivorans]OJX98051.1 MAG: hypothetical protein BGO96_14375 [Micrococcales bacterium 73-15]